MHCPCARQAVNIHSSAQQKLCRCAIISARSTLIMFDNMYTHTHKHERAAANHSQLATTDRRRRRRAAATLCTCVCANCATFAGTLVSRLPSHRVTCVQQWQRDTHYNFAAAPHTCPTIVCSTCSTARAASGADSAQTDLNERDLRPSLDTHTASA